MARRPALHSGPHADLRQARRAFDGGQALSPVRFGPGVVGPLDVPDMVGEGNARRDVRGPACTQLFICSIHIMEHPWLGAPVEQDVMERPDQHIPVAAPGEDMDTRARCLVEAESPGTIVGQEVSDPGLRLFLRAVAEIIDRERMLHVIQDFLPWSTIIEEEEPTPQHVVARYRESPRRPGSA